VVKFLLWCICCCCAAPGPDRAGALPLVWLLLLPFRVVDCRGWRALAGVGAGDAARAPVAGM